jgi:hypothetical protein
VLRAENERSGASNVDRRLIEQMQKSRTLPGRQLHAAPPPSPPNRSASSVNIMSTAAILPHMRSWANVISRTFSVMNSSTFVKIRQD